MEFTRQSISIDADTIYVMHRNLSVTTTSIVRFITCDLFSDVFDDD